MSALVLVNVNISRDTNLLQYTVELACILAATNSAYSYFEFINSVEDMNELVRCTILMVLSSGVQAKLTNDRISVSKSMVYKIDSHMDDMKNDFKASLLEFVTDHLGDFQKNMVLSTIGCSICDRILSVLMNASVQSFSTTNNIAVTNYSAIPNITANDLVMRNDGMVVLMMDNLNQFFEQFTKLQLMFTWNPRSRHLIFTRKKPTDEELELIFRECWSSRVLNVAVIIWNRKEAYTYNPYLKSQFKMSETVLNWSSLFYDKLRNMNGYSIRTRYIPFSSTDTVKWIEEEGRYKFFGTDFAYMEAFFQNVNATPALINLTADTMSWYRNFSSRNKIWKERKFNGAELWMNFMPVQGVFRDRSERAYPLGRDNIRVLAPKSSLKIPSIFEPYHNTTWTCVVLSLITVAIYYRVLYKIRGIDDNAFLRTFGVFLGKNLANRRHGRLEKFTFLVFTMTSMLILSAYQGALYGALATVSYYPEIDTMDQLQKRVERINAYRVLVEYLRAGTQSGISVVEFVTVDNFGYMKTHCDEAYAFPNSMAQFFARLKILSENEIPLYHVMNEFSFPAFVSHTLPYGSPYLRKLERVFLAGKEGGLEQYWEAEANLNDILSGTVIPNVAGEKPLKKLSLESQLIGFYIWGLGLLGSSFCFLTEIYFHRYGNKITKLRTSKMQLDQ